MKLTSFSQIASLIFAVATGSIVWPRVEKKISFCSQYGTMYFVSRFSNILADCFDHFIIRMSISQKKLVTSSSISRLSKLIYQIFLSRNFN